MKVLQTFYGCECSYQFLLFENLLVYIPKSSSLVAENTCKVIFPCSVVCFGFIKTEIEESRCWVDLYENVEV